VGAVDVVPFVPIDTPLPDCVNAARRFGATLWEQLSVPVYFYGEAAVEPARCDLSDLRPALLRAAVGQGETLRPDIGQGSHPTAGVSLVGARFPLIAFNVYLDSEDLPAARRIASRVRERGGGLPAVKALGFAIPARRAVQVSMNLVHYPTTSIALAFRRVVQEARAEGIETLGSELVGLAPADALDETTARSVGLEDFGPHRILEERIREVVR